MGQSSSGEPQRELLYAEDGITVIGSTFSVGGEKAAPEWFGMGPQSLGFVGPGPQINPKVYCTPHAPNRLPCPTLIQGEAPHLTVFNRSPRPVNVSLGTDGKHFLQPGRLTRFLLPDGEGVLYITDPCSGACLCDLRGLPAGGQPLEALPRAILQELGGTLCASLEYSFPRMEEAPDPSKKLSEKKPSACASLEDTEQKASPRTIELEEQLLEALQSNNHCRAQEILAARLRFDRQLKRAFPGRLRRHLCLPEAFCRRKCPSSGPASKKYLMQEAVDNCSCAPLRSLVGASVACLLSRAEMCIALHGAICTPYVYVDSAALD
ncbi:unnamed protein product [Symbiodinium natans]|uniref:Uncharacterized protein n=1 Tax=Symbiodinium natans TaxID=878477 RepID=A0A812J1G7_9DINO|nr:unnamed protein product [Symbiodinium natans]